MHAFWEIFQRLFDLYTPIFLNPENANRARSIVIIARDAETFVEIIVNANEKRK